MGRASREQPSLTSVSARLIDACSCCLEKKGRRDNALPGCAMMNWRCVVFDDEGAFACMHAEMTSPVQAQLGHSWHERWMQNPYMLQRDLRFSKCVLEMTKSAVGKISHTLKAAHNAQCSKLFAQRWEDSFVVVDNLFIFPISLFY